MSPTTLKLLGYDTLLSFVDTEKFTINRFYDIITTGLINNKYVLHVESINHDGIPYNEWIVFDLTSSNTFAAATELHSYILNSINISNKMNSDLLSSITFEDGKGDFDEKVKDISIAYYRYL